MVKMRAYSVTWMDCYCEVHSDLVLLPDEQPKGTLAVENWMNSYPRKLLDWKTPQEINLCEKYA